MDVTPAGMVTLVRPVFWNAKLSIRVTFEGMLIEVSLLQSWNALSPIVPSWLFVAKITPVRLVHP